MDAPEVKYGRLTVRLANPDDAVSLSKRLEPWCIIECLCLDQTPLEALMMPFRTGEGHQTRTVLWGGYVIAMAGVTRDHGNGTDVGFVWLLNSPIPHAARRPFIRAALDGLRWAHERFSLLHNIVPANAQQPVRFLQRTGFDFRDDLLHLRGVPFRRFYRRGEQRPQG